MKPVCQFNRGYGINDEADALPPLADDASEDEDDDIEFHADEGDGIEDEARFHSYDEPQLASKALFFRSWWTPINVRMDDPFQWKMIAIECQ